MNPKIFYQVLVKSLLTVMTLRYHFAFCVAISYQKYLDGGGGLDKGGALVLGGGGGASVVNVFTLERN